MTVTDKFVYVAHHFILLWLHLFCLKVDSFACQERVLKTFPGLGYLHSEDGVV